jgi:hypothetical protein
MVAISLPSGEVIGPDEVKPRDVEVVKGRRRRVRKLGIVAAIRMSVKMVVWRMWRGVN